ncbi:MAG: hypothetical protein CYG59_11595 [Chloroflexi bacterium]|nr:MAG: hypothetical protein CYG59_11595 [Chloroflexota bacterium]
MTIHTGAQAPQLQPTIMIVEDDTNLQILLVELLESEGYRPVVTSSGAQALQAVAASPPDLVLLDLGLPDIHGQQLCQQIRAVVENPLPILMVSAQRDPRQVLAALHAGADDYVRKPFAPDELLCQIRAHLPLTALLRDETAQPRCG